MSSHRAWTSRVLAVVPLLILLLTVLLTLWVTLRVAWSVLLPERLVEVCHLFVELAPSLSDLVEARVALGVCGAVVRCFFAACRAAGAPNVADEASTCKVRQRRRWLM